jgi:hypothetical protein
VVVLRGELYLRRGLFVAALGFPPCLFGLRQVGDIKVIMAWGRGGIVMRGGHRQNAGHFGVSAYAALMSWSCLVDVVMLACWHAGMLCAVMW